MDVVFSSDNIPHAHRGGAVAIGNFDGVHFAHQKIIQDAALHAKALKAPLVVYTFWPHPTSTLVPKSAPKMIQTRTQRIKALRALGVSLAVLEQFDTAFSRRSAESFCQEILGARLGVRHVSVGYDFTFGYHRMGNAQSLVEWGRPAGISVSVTEPVFAGETLVSSSTVRRLLADGEVEEAEILLTRPYEYAGRVIPGDGRGKSLGFPTANLDGYNDMLLKEGVYAVWAECEGKRLPGVINVGKNPTFIGERPIHVEVHLFNFSGDLYGKDLSVFPVRYLRGEQTFSDLSHLRDQIARDVKAAQGVLSA